MLIVWHKLIWEKAITKKRIYSNTYERNQNKDVIIIIINTRTKKYKFSPFNNYFIIRENKNLKQKVETSTLMTGVMNTLSFQCRETKHAWSFKKMPIWFFYMVVLWLKTSIISDFAARLHLMQTRNFQLLNTWHENFDF